METQDDSNIKSKKEIPSVKRVKTMPLNPIHIARLDVHCVFKGSEIAKDEKRECSCFEEGSEYLCKQSCFCKFCSAQRYALFMHLHGDLVTKQTKLFSDFLLAANAVLATDGGQITAAIDSLADCHYKIIRAAQIKTAPVFTLPHTNAKCNSSSTTVPIDYFIKSLDGVTQAILDSIVYEKELAFSNS